MPLCRLEEVHAASSLKKECSIIFELEDGHCESSFPICSCMAWFISQVSSGQFKWVELYMIVHAICDHPRVLFVTSLQTLFNWFELFVNRIVGLRLNFNTNRSKLSTCIKHYQSIYFFLGGEPPWGVFESCRPRSLCMATWVEPNPPWEASSRGKCGGRGRLGEPRFGWILEALNGPFGNPNFG